MLRISVVKRSDEGIQLQVEGWLVGPWVEELRKQSEQALSDSNALSLDLEKLWFVDSQGVGLLRDLARRDVTHLNCSTFISQQLKETTV